MLKAADRFDWPQPYVSRRPKCVNQNQSKLGNMQLRDLNVIQMLFYSLAPSQEYCNHFCELKQNQREYQQVITRL